MRLPAVNTGIVLPLPLHRLLREAARGRQRAAGGCGRVSVSSLITDLLQQHRAELETEARRL
jgi:hypothetical protein